MITKKLAPSGTLIENCRITNSSFGSHYLYIPNANKIFSDPMDMYSRLTIAAPYTNAIYYGGGYPVIGPSSVYWVDGVITPYDTTVQCTITNAPLGDYSDMSGAVSGLNSLFPLTDNVTLLITKGQIYGDVNTIYTIGTGKEWNNHHMYFAPDPLTVGAPPVMWGTYVFNANTFGRIYVHFSRLILGNINTAMHQSVISVIGDMGNGGGGALYADNCIIYQHNTTSVASAFGDTGGIGYVTQCYYFLSNATTGFELYSGNGVTGNSFIGIWTDGGNKSSQDSTDPSATRTTILGYIYGGGGSFNFSWATNTAIGNPHLTDNIIQSISDTPAVMYARNAQPTSLSTLLIDAGNLADVVGPDILNVTRSTRDLGAYQYISVAPPTTITLANTIGISGRNYSTISAWETATSYNLVSSGNIRIGYCYNDSSFRENVTIAGAPSNSGNYRKLTVASGNYHYHNGSLYQGTNVSGSFYITDPYFYLDGLRIHHESSLAGFNALYMDGTPGSGLFTTINRVLIHDWVSSGNGVSAYGIFANKTGGIKIYNTVLYNLYKANDNNDTGSQAGILFTNCLSGSLYDSYIYNCLVYNIQASGYFTFMGGGIGSYGPGASGVHVKNTISIVNGYTDDRSSDIPEVANVYRFDYFNEFSSDSDYNCGMGGGYSNQIYDTYVPGSHSLIKQNPATIFFQSAPYTRSSDGFIGCNFNTGAGFSGVWTRKFEESRFYPVQPGEFGTISFQAMENQYCQAGFLYRSASGIGPVSGIINLVYNGPSIYNYDYNTLNRVSGPAQHLQNINHSIRFNPNAITIDWVNALLTPPDAPYTRDPNNSIFVSGTIISGLINIGTENYDQKGYLTSNVTIPPVNFKLLSTAPIRNSGVYISGVPELMFDILGNARSTNSLWDIGPFNFVGSPWTPQRNLIFGSGVISNNSTLNSGSLVNSHISSIPTVILQEKLIGNTNYKIGLFSLTIQSSISSNWKFFLEVVHQSNPIQYILYSVGGISTNQYGLYTEKLEIHISANDIESFQQPAYLWAQSTDRSYTTVRRPIYFRNLN